MADRQNFKPNDRFRLIGIVRGLTASGSHYHKQPYSYWLSVPLPLTVDQPYAAQAPFEKIPSTW